MSTTTAWFYLRDGQQVGPVDIEQLRAALRNGSLQPSDLVWREGLAAWVPANTLPELGAPSAAFASAPAGLSPSLASRTAGAYIPYASSTQAGITYAGFWKRVAAIIIDWFVMLIPTFVAGFIIGFIMGASGMAMETIELAGNLIGILVYWLYFAAMESSRHQGTLGKMALGIKVTDLNGQPITFGRASGRHFAKIISGIILGVGFIMAAFTEKKQALHDSVASCLVINRA